MESPSLTDSQRKLTLLAMALLIGLPSCLMLFLGSARNAFHAAERLSGSYTCTVYFTPEEKGYTEAEGFSPPSEELPSISEEKKFSPDFLKAVRMEGFGQLSTPIDGKSYLAFDGSWHLAGTPLGRKSIPLVPQLSCAIGDGSGNLEIGAWILIRSQNLPTTLSSRAWRVDDYGPGVGARQLDLYWGPDVSLDTGDAFYQPSRMPLGRVSDVTVYVLPADSTAIRILGWLNACKLDVLADWLLPTPPPMNTKG